MPISSLPPAPELVPHLDALRQSVRSAPLGLYLHVPFCIDRCTYCSFITTCDRSLEPEVLARLGTDLTAWGQALDRPYADTLYLGGGTPSVLSLEAMSRLTASAREAFDLSPLREATLEANPGTVDPAWLRGARGLGWDRISLGIQTLDDELLQRLGRIHDAREGLVVLAQAREAGFERISADLMIGIPGQNLNRVLADVRQIAEAGANHLSVYMLDLDKACPLKALVDSGTLALPSEDAVAEAFEALQEELPNLGFPAYEISNYAQSGQASIHNTRYWERRPYLGFGPSAASHLGPWRWTESGDIRAWTEGTGTREIQELDAAAELAEIPLLGLRMLRGVDWEDLRTRAQSLELLPLVETWERELAPFLRHGLLLREGPNLRFSRKGLLLSNSVLETFV
jgi:oxygen-independent coproporphyrinogen III oxidase